MKKPTFAVNVLWRKALTALDDYTDLGHVTADTEQLYLGVFGDLLTAIKTLQGVRRCETIVEIKEELSFLLLPNRLRIYRGYYEAEKRIGISWSLSRKVAEGFAYSYRPHEHPEPKVVTGFCLKSNALAYTNGRNEQEIIIDPDNVRNIENIKVRGKPSFPVKAAPIVELVCKRQHHGSEIIPP